MMKPVFDFGKQAVSLVRDVQQSKENIKDLQQANKEMRQEQKELRQELHDLSKIVQHFAFRVERTEENERHEREKMALRLENTLLRYQQGLPPATPDKSHEIS